MLRKLNADSNRARDAPLPSNETAALEQLHHLIDTRRRDKEVPLEVGFGWRPTKAGDVFRDKREVLKLPLGGLLTGAFRHKHLRMLERSDEFFGTGFDHQLEATREMNHQALLFDHCDAQYLLTLKGLSEPFSTERSRWHVDSVIGVLRRAA